MDYFIFYELYLLLFPLLGLLLYRLYSKNKKHKQALVFSGILIGLILSLRFLSISFRGDFADTIIESLIYLLYASIIPFIRLIKNKNTRKIATFTSYLPIAMGYILATVGFMGLMLIGIDKEAEETVRINENIEYRKYIYGYAFSDGGVNYEFYKSQPNSLFEKQIAKIEIDNCYTEQKIKFVEETKSYQIELISNNETKIDTIIMKK